MINPAVIRVSSNVEFQRDKDTTKVGKQAQEKKQDNWQKIDRENLAKKQAKPKKLNCQTKSAT